MASTPTHPQQPAKPANHQQPPPPQQKPINVAQAAREDTHKPTHDPQEAKFEAHAGPPHWKEPGKAQNPNPPPPDGMSSADEQRERAAEVEAHGQKSLDQRPDERQAHLRPARARRRGRVRQGRRAQAGPRRHAAHQAGVTAMSLPDRRLFRPGRAQRADPSRLPERGGRARRDRDGAVERHRHARYDDHDPAGGPAAGAPEQFALHQRRASGGQRRQGGQSHRGRHVGCDHAGVASEVPPVNTAAPVVSGTGTVGQNLTTTNGTWTERATAYAYQWMRGGSQIRGAINAVYALVGADSGTSVSCRVTATNPAGSTSIQSNAIAVA